MSPIIKFIYFLLAFIVIGIITIIALFYLDGDKHLGSGYYLFNNRRLTCIVLSDSSNYESGGHSIIPEYVTNVAYNDSYIIAKSTPDLKGVYNIFWIIDKRNVPNYRDNRTFARWDSVMWQNVSQYPDSASFYQALKAKNIDLEFDD